MMKKIVAADTSFLLSLLGTDTNTPKAQALIESLTCPLTLNSMNDLEVLNAS